jgi:hypothetical protein
MNEHDPARDGLKRKLLHELAEYLMTAAYLAAFFGVFTWYRRLILAQYQVSYLHYGIALIEALILAKVIWLGNLLGLGRRLKNKPLIYPTLYQAAVFTGWVAVFGLLEKTLTDLLRGQGLIGGVDELWQEGADALLARCLIVFFAFIPFFAFKELSEALGEGRIRRLFFRAR